MEYLEEYEEWGSAEEEALVEELISDWTFFVLSPGLTKTILVLNDKLGSEYFNAEYEKLAASEGDNSDSEELVASDSWFRERFQQVSEILFHGGEQTEHPVQSEEEVLSFFQAFISERIFNHLAMLSRSPHARKGRPFSIREELTKEVAEKIGLGLYLHHEIPSDLRAKAEEVLLGLAFEFQRWFIEEHRGVFFTTWGTLYAVDRKRDSGDDYEGTLILEPDVEPHEAFVVANDRASIRSEEVLPEAIGRT